MATPSPTVYVPEPYDVNSAGNFNGKPLIEQLHNYPHVGEDDYQTNAEYRKSIAGFFASVVIIGFVVILCMWCINLCACFKICRVRCFPSCFNVFAHRVMRGKLTVIFLFFVAAIIAMCSYPGRNEFNDAVFEAGDEIRLLGATFAGLESESDDMTIQSATLNAATDATDCSDSSTDAALVTAASSFASAAEEVAKLLDGQAETLNDAADWIEENLPQFVDMGIFAITALIWVNALFGIVAIMTDRCKCDDCLLILFGSLTLLVLCVLVGVELTLSVTVADFCYKTPEASIMLATGEKMINYYLTCNGTSPLESPFDEARSAMATLRENVRLVKATPALTCDDAQLEIIMETNNATIISLNEMESMSDCPSLNPRFQGLLHGIICDEVVRGIFFCFLAHCVSAVILVITFCIFPCAANTKPLIDDPKALFRKLDADKSGSLTKDEVIKGAIEFKMTPAQAGALFDALDKDGSGTLSLEELSMMENHKKFSEEWELAQGELRKHLAKLGLEKFLSKLGEFGIDHVEDLYDTGLCGDGALRNDVGMTEADIAKLRANQPRGN